MKVTAKATRSGDWWAIEVPEVPGVFTQAKRLDQVADMVADAVALMEDIEPADVEVTLRPEISEERRTILLDAITARLDAARLEREANSARARVAAELSADGLPLRDIGVILHVSHQRVAQLLEVAREEADRASQFAVEVAEVGARVEREYELRQARKANGRDVEPREVERRDVEPRDVPRRDVEPKELADGERPRPRVRRR